MILKGSDSIEVKFTRGSWDTVEDNENGHLAVCVENYDGEAGNLSITRGC